MTEVVRPYRGVSAEERRGQRRSQLLEACLDVVAEVGVADTTAEGVCARAGLSKRYFYESFADREAILVAILDDLFDRVSIAIAELIEGGEALPEDERVRRTVTVLVRELSVDLRAARVYVEAPRHPTLEQRRLRAFDDFARLLLAEHVLNVEADDRRAYPVALMIVAGTTEVMARWLSGELALSEDEVVDVISGVGLAAGAFVRGGRP